MLTCLIWKYCCYTMLIAIFEHVLPARVYFHCPLKLPGLDPRNPQPMNDSAAIDESLIDDVSLCLTVLVQFLTFDCMWFALVSMHGFFVSVKLLHACIRTLFSFFFSCSLFFCFPPCLFSPCCMKDEENLWKLSVCLDICVSVNRKPEERWRTYLIN